MAGMPDSFKRDKSEYDMIRDLAHSHDNTTQGTMAIVASDMTLYTTYMSKSELQVAFNRRQT